MVKMSFDGENREEPVSDCTVRKHELSVAVETIGNLLYLIDFDAERPERIRKYTGMAEKSMTALLRLAREE
jgi:hypothetical protein